MIGMFFVVFSYITDTSVKDLIDKEDVRGFVAEVVEDVREAAE